MTILFFPNIISKDNFPLVSECIHLVWKWLYEDVEILFWKCALKKNLLINLFPFELLELEDF